MKSNLFFVVLLLGLGFVLAQPMMEGDMGVPKEAVDACDGKAEGDSCTFPGLGDDVVRGVCENDVCFGKPETYLYEGEAASGLVSEESEVGFFGGIWGWFVGLFVGEEEMILDETLEDEDFLVGGDEDEYGCKASAGYSWCEEKGKCLRVWEEDCVLEVGGKGVVDSMQDKCYDDSSEVACSTDYFYGQDAQYEGLQASYVDNMDGTVSDLNTGLMWQQDSGEKQMYYDAVGGVEDFELAGYSDWRVPSIKELYSLMDFRGIDPNIEAEDDSGLVPFIDSEYFEFSYGDVASGQRIIDSQWVTSSIYEATVMNGRECFFGVNFADGRIKCYPTDGRNSGYFAIYVRGEVYGANDFKDNGDGTVSDLSSDLVWMRGDSGEGLNWEDALKYCEELELAGYGDWRLPNVKELEYVVDYGRSPDSTDSAAMDEVFGISEIVNEAGEEDYPFFWSGTTHVGQGKGRTGAYVGFGRCVGYMGDGWLDVHGAGCQRSDPKSGDAGEYPEGRGPQGDAVRIYNYVRCVRG